MRKVRLKEMGGKSPLSMTDMDKRLTKSCSGGRNETPVNWATHARHIKKVPAEAVAYLLHHRVTLEGSTRSLTISEATAYYSRMPVEQLLALLFEAQSMLVAHEDRSYLQAPTPRTLEQMDVALRQVFEQWSLIGPTALGFCSAGLCVRPNNR